MKYHLRTLKVINHLKLSSKVVVIEKVTTLHPIPQSGGWVGTSLFKIIEFLKWC